MMTGAQMIGYHQFTGPDLEHCAYVWCKTPCGESALNHKDVDYATKQRIDYCELVDTRVVNSPTTIDEFIARITEYLVTWRYIKAQYGPCSVPIHDAQVRMDNATKMIDTVVCAYAKVINDRNEEAK
jgi:hypothetical protein